MCQDCVLPSPLNPPHHQTKSAPRPLPLSLLPVHPPNPSLICVSGLQAPLQVKSDASSQKPPHEPFPGLTGIRYSLTPGGLYGYGHSKNPWPVVAYRHIRWGWQITCPPIEFGGIRSLSASMVLRREMPLFTFYWAVMKPWM